MSTPARALPIAQQGRSAGVEPLPVLYQTWIEQFLTGPIPRESRATCDRCAMVKRPDSGVHVPIVEFRPEIKCCSYIPDLPNYLVGLALADGDVTLEYGKRTLRQRVNDQRGVTPLGLRAPASFLMLYDSVGNSVFGRTQAFKCPHYSPAEGGRCGIWRYRNSVCSTYFCKFERGAKGYEFWGALRDLLRSIEEQLAFWCVNQIIDDHRAIESILEARSASQAKRLSEELLDQPTTPNVKAMWGEWDGREQEFYRLCGERVLALTWREVLEICGAETTARSKVAAAAFVAMTEQIVPSRLTAASELLPMGRDKVVPIVTHSPADPLFVPAEVYGILNRFDGRRTNDVLAEIRASGTEIDEPLLQRLLDYRILSEADETPPQQAIPL